MVNAEAFLKYCCPECDFTIKDRALFNEHALENHFESKVLFKSADETLVDVSDIINSTIKDNLGPSQHFVRTIFETKYQSSKTIH